MSTENMRKLIMLAESLDEDYHTDYHDDEVQRYYDMGKRNLWILYNDTLEDEDYPGRTDELQYMEAALDRYDISVAEGLGEDYRDDPNRPGWKDEEGNWNKYEDCPTCHGWGEVVAGKDSRDDFDYDLDDVVPCPDCGPADGPAAQGKSKIVKQMANDLDMDYTDLPLRESFTRKHFQMVADTLQMIEDPDVRQAQAEEFARQFAAANPRFRRDLFMKAAGVEELNEDPGDDTEWDAHWAREDGDDERADDLDWDAEFARMDADDDELDEKQRKTSDDEIRQQKRDRERGISGEQMWDRLVKADQVGGVKTKRSEEWFESDEFIDDKLRSGEIDADDVDYDWEENELTEETSKFRLAEIIGKDGLAALLADLRSGGIDYNGSYFKDLYWHFLDEYPDEIPVGSRTGRPEDPEEYVLDNLERYHSGEIKQYMNTPDMDESNCGVCGETFKWEGSPDEEMCPRCTQEYLGENEGWFDDLGTGEEFARGEDDGDVPSRRVSDEELTGVLLKKVESALNFLAQGMEAESKLGNSSTKQQAIMLRRDLKEIKAYLESGQKLTPLFSIVQRANNAVNELTDLSYEFDDVQVDVQDAENLLYLHLNGRPVAIDESEDKGKPYICVHVKKGKHECYADTSYGAAKKAAEHWGLKSTAGIDAHLAIDEASCPCGKDGCECGPDCDCEPVKESANDNWGVGDYVVTTWEKPGQWDYPLEVIGVQGDQVLVQDDYGNKGLMFPEDLRKAESVEEGEVKGVNDKYDDKLNCKHCGSYYCTSKFGGECPEIQMDMFGDELEEDISLDSIVESLLDERGQPKDYELSDDELATEIEDETSEFERDRIDPEIEDEELGLRFD